MLVASGPLEAWYVDAVHQADPGADVTPGLSRSGAADCRSTAAGPAVGGASNLVGPRFDGTGRAYALAGVPAGLAGLPALGLSRDMPGSPEHGAPQDVADEDRR